MLAADDRANGPSHNEDLERVIDLLTQALGILDEMPGNAIAGARLQTVIDELEGGREPD